MYPLGYNHFPLLTAISHFYKVQSNELSGERTAIVPLSLALHLIGSMITHVIIITW